MPLTGLGAPLVSFPFVEVDHALPSQGLMRQIVLVLVARFRMSVAEIVMAYTLVSPHTIEPQHHPSQPTPRSRCPSPKHQPPRSNQVDRMLLLNPSLLRCYSVRPIFLGCCVLAVKVSREGDTSICCLLSRVQDVFNLLDATLLSRIEHQLLEVLSSQPAPYSPTASTSHLFAPQPVRQCGAGAELADAHGRRAISSLRRRALRRGSGRAPRAAHAGRELDGEARVRLSVCCVLRQGGREEAQRLNEID